MAEGADMKLNSTTETFARQSRDRRPITEDAPSSTLAERVITAACIVAALIVIGLMALENHFGGGPLP